MWIYVFCAIVASIAYLYQRKTKKRLREYRNIAVPPENFLIGHSFQFFNLGPVGVLKKMEEFGRKYSGQNSGRFRLHLGLDISTIIYNPEDLEVAMQHPKLNEKSNDYDFFKPWLGTGLLLSHGPKWFARRKAITSAFHFSILDNFIEVFDRNANALADRLGKIGPDTTFDVTKLITLYTLDVICEAAMGTKINALNESESKYVKAVVEISAILFERSFNGFTRNEWIWKWTSAKKRHDELLKILHGFTDSVIAARRKEIETQGEESTPEEDQNADVMYGRKRRYALLDLLLKSSIDGKPLSDEDIREEVDDFMFAGHDTTTCTISFLIYNLARHPKIQQKVYEEIVEVLGTNSAEPVTMPKLNSLKYFDLVFKESLRLHTPVPFIGRHTREDIMINDMLIPKDTNVGIAIYLMSLDPKYYPDPYAFKPERFDVERSADKVNPFSYIPFSAGPRNCIGQKFAQFEVKTAISRLLQNFEISLGYEGFEPILLGEVVLKSANGIQIKLKPRQK